jgi:hypothetical protein
LCSGLPKASPPHSRQEVEKLQRTVITQDSEILFAHYTFSTTAVSSLSVYRRAYSRRGPHLRAPIRAETRDGFAEFSGTKWALMHREFLIRVLLAFPKNQWASILLIPSGYGEALITQLGFDLAVGGHLPALTFSIMAIPLKNPGAVLGFPALDV